MSFKTIDSKHEGAYPEYELDLSPIAGGDKGSLSVQHCSCQPYPYIRLAYEDAFNGFWVDIPAEKVHDLIGMMSQSIVIAAGGNHKDSYAKLKESDEQQEVK